MKKIMKQFTVILSFLALFALPVSAEEPDLQQLSNTVVSVHNMLSSTQHVEVVKTLFALTDETEIDTAVQCLLRPRCLESYEKMFAIISKLKPTAGELPQLAYYEFKNMELSYAKYPEMKILFISDGIMMLWSASSSRPTGGY